MKQNNMDYMNIPKEKFAFCNDANNLHDKRLETKPVGYFQDAMMRFARNKSSVIAAWIILFLVVFAIVAPLPNVNFDKINFGSFFKQTQIDENFVEQINSKKLNEYEVLIESTLYSKGYHNVDVKIDADKQSSTFKILKVNVDLSGLVLNDKNLNINKYDQIKAIVKSIVGVREEDILFYG